LTLTLIDFAGHSFGQRYACAASADEQALMSATRAMRLVREEGEAWTARLDAAVSSGRLDDVPFLQTAAWATNKSVTGWESVRLVLEAPDGAWIGAQFLVHRLPARLGALAYAPRGPIVVPTRVVDGATLRAEYLVAVRALRDEGVTLVRLEPGEAEPLREDEDQVQPPTRATDAARAEWTRAAAHAKVPLAPAKPLQQRSSRRIDLRGGIDAVRAGWRRTSSASVRRAEAAGVRMRVGGPGDADALREVMVAIAGRTGVQVRSAAAFAHLLASFGPRAELAIAESTEGHVVGALLLASTTTTTTEIFGGATDLGNTLRAPYALKAHAMQRAVLLGSRTYDMWGISTPGIAEFKAAWGGQAFAYPGAFDLTIDRMRGPLLRIALRARGFGG
jgi:lipid II:glycine glycyltransferase (peptidoglycan interpeptide bridge formation enzyme)